MSSVVANEPTSSSSLPTMGDLGGSSTIDRGQAGSAVWNTIIATEDVEVLSTQLANADGTRPLRGYAAAQPGVAPKAMLVLQA